MGVNLFYLDTSALLKRYKLESGSETMDELFSHSHFPAKRLLTTVFTILEVSSACERLFRVGIISQTSYGKLMKAFSADTDRSIHFLSVDDDIILSASEISQKYFLRTGDAIQLASLVRARESVSGYDIEIVFLASDNALCRSATQEGFTVLNPVEISKNELNQYLS